MSSVKPRPPSAGDFVMPSAATDTFARSKYAKMYRKNKNGSKCTVMRRFAPDDIHPAVAKTIDLLVAGNTAVRFALTHAHSPVRVPK
jgi:hypothetical protein